MEIRRSQRGCVAWWAVVPVVALLAIPLAADTPATQREADSLTRKLIGMLQFEQAPAGSPRLTPVTEGEVNSFLRLTFANRLPVGLRQPQVGMIGDGRVLAKAIVDLDAVRRGTQGRGDLLDPRQLLTGQVPVTIEGRLVADNGRARFQFGNADVGGIPVPKLLVQQVVTYYSRSPEFPSGVDLDAPFDLPARIREIHIDEHQAVVVQR